MSYAGNERITKADLARAMEIYRDALKGAGITYDGHLGLDEGSKTYGRAFRIYRTGYMVPCQFCRGLIADECGRCDDNNMMKTSGHSNPPVGSDYLGMTKREAYEELCHRASIIRDTTYAMKESK